MGFSNPSPKVAGGDNSGMGLLLVFLSGNSTSINVDKTELFSPRRSNSSPILSKAQSTISICFILLCLTLLLFTLSTFEPTSAKNPQINASTTRRMLSEKPSSSSWLDWSVKSKSSSSKYEVALQGMGALFRRGTGAMTDLVVGHVADDVTSGELRLFLRLLHRSGLTARSDLVLVFDSLVPSKFADVIDQENDSFLGLLHRYQNLSDKSPPLMRFDPTRFVKPAKPEPAESIWGRKRRSNYTEPEIGSTRFSYGSVVAFDATELDPEDSLSGFVAHPPMGLRRWACYPMLLGRVRRNFKHTILIDVKNILLLGDPLNRIRNRGAESVQLTTGSIKHGKRNNISPGWFNPGLIAGGSRGIRRFANAMVTEIARVAISQHKKKSAVTEPGVLSQLGSNENLLKSKGVNLVKSSEPVHEAFTNRLDSGATSVIYRGNNNGNYHELRQIIMKQICSFEVDSSVYRDC